MDTHTSLLDWSSLPSLQTATKQQRRAIYRLIADPQNWLSSLSAEQASKLIYTLVECRQQAGVRGADTHISDD